MHILEGVPILLTLIATLLLLLQGDAILVWIPFMSLSDRQSCTLC